MIIYIVNIYNFNNKHEGEKKKIDIKRKRGKKTGNLSLQFFLLITYFWIYTETSVFEESLYISTSIISSSTKRIFGTKVQFM